jgi:hypothetical protein
LLHLSAIRDRNFPDWGLGFWFPLHLLVSNACLLCPSLVMKYVLMLGRHALVLSRDFNLAGVPLSEAVTAIETNPDGKKRDTSRQASLPRYYQPRSTRGL